MEPIMLNAELNRSRRMGAEFEMTVPLVGAGTGTDVQRTLAEVLSANGIRAVSRSYQSSPVPNGMDVAVEYDSSIRGESRYNGITWLPIEIKTRILNGIDDWEAIVPRTLQIARYMGARVNRSCGHHLHVEVAEINDESRIIRSLYALHYKFQDVIYGLVSPSRRENGYARPLPHLPSLLQCRSRSCFDRTIRSNWARQYALNLTHVPSSSPRIEYRWHHGTLDADKARHWMRFCNRLVQHAVDRRCQFSDSLANDRKALERLLVSTGFKVNRGIYAKVSPELRDTGKYLLRRWKHFNGNIPLKSKDDSGESDGDA